MKKKKTAGDKIELLAKIAVVGMMTLGILALSLFVVLALLGEIGEI